MGLFTKKADPISDRARALSAEITALEDKIKKLAAQAENQPRWRSTTLPHGPTLISNPAQTPPAKPKSRDPIFEEIDQNKLQPPADPPPSPQQFNELGVRKYDPAGFFRRLQGHFRGKPVSNPKLVNYLAAGSIHGLRPLRYEKRVARNRFVFLSVVFLLVMWGIVAFLVRHH